MSACQKEKTFVIPEADADNGGLFLPGGFGALVVADSVGLTRHLAVRDNGDIYVKMAKPNEASTAYQRALKALGEQANPEKKALIQMKLDDLGNPHAQEKAA